MLIADKVLEISFFNGMKTVNVDVFKFCFDPNTDTVHNRPIGETQSDNYMEQVGNILGKIG